jgi:fructokinase
MNGKYGVYILIKPSILGIGFSCLDIIKTQNKEMFLPGGTCANVLAVLSSLNWNSTLLKSSYNDKWSEYIDLKLTELGMTIHNYNSLHKNTPRVVQITDNNKHSFLTKCPICNRKLINIITPSVNKIASDENIDFSKFDILFYDRVSESSKYLSSFAKKYGKWTFYEPNGYRLYSQLLNNISKANIVKFSSERIPLEIANKIIYDLNSLGKSTKLIIVTGAEKGVNYSCSTNHIFSDFRIVKIKPFSDVIDSSGAGDWLTAGFIYEFIKNHKQVTNDIDDDVIITSIKYGHKLSKIGCSSIGALGALIQCDNNDIIKHNKECIFCKTI